jgi:hypothetical protein
VMAAGLDLQLFGRRDPDVDVLRESVDDTEALGQGCAALEFEVEPLSSQPQKAMHDPVVLPDQCRIKASFVSDHGKQVAEVLAVMQKFRHSANLWLACGSPQSQTSRARV